MIAIPFREQRNTDRRAQLTAVVAALRAHFDDRAARIVVVEQLPGKLFHRGALINAAYRWTRDKYPDATRIVAHDCDLLPDARACGLYAEPHAFHCVAAVSSRYQSDAFVGGVTAWDLETFERLNGFPVVDAFGWGGEDDELRRRALTCGVEVHRNTTVGHFQDLEGLDLAGKLAWLRAQGEKNGRKYELRDAHHDTWARNGLSSHTHTVERSARCDDYDWLFVRV